MVLTVVRITSGTSTAPDDESLVQVDIPSSQESLAEVVESLSVENE
jgi:hypothetical protein